MSCRSCSTWRAARGGVWGEAARPSAGSGEAAARMGGKRGCRLQHPGIGAGWECKLGPRRRGSGPRGWCGVRGQSCSFVAGQMEARPTKTLLSGQLISKPRRQRVAARWAAGTAISPKSVCGSRGADCSSVFSVKTGFLSLLAEQPDVTGPVLGGSGRTPRPLPAGPRLGGVGGPFPQACRRRGARGVLVTGTWPSSCGACPESPGSACRRRPAGGRPRRPPPRQTRRPR